MITTHNELESLVERALQKDSVALDTEFIWERSYYPQLGLIQIALSNDECYLIDPTELTDLSALGELLNNKKTIKILHDAPQDLAILQRATGAVPQAVFDTKIAAGFCGLPGTMSLAALIEELLEINLAKSETRTNWLQRPLSDEQISYAEDDVRYLRAARVVLLSRVYSPEVHSFMKEEMDNFITAPGYYWLEDELRYTKVKGAGSLNKRSLAVLRELANWREKRARKADKPRGHIVPDQVLTHIARGPLTTEKEILLESTISKKAGKKYLAEILSAVNKGINCPQNNLPDSLKAPKLTAKNHDDLEKLTKMIRLKSDTKGIDPSLVASVSDLKYFVKNIHNQEKLKAAKLYNGWRKGFIKEFLIEF